MRGGKEPIKGALQGLAMLGVEGGGEGGGGPSGLLCLQWAGPAERSRALLLRRPGAEADAGLQCVLRAAGPAALITDLIPMADSAPLLSLDGDPMATETLLRSVFGMVLEEIVWKGTSTSEKVCEWKEPEELRRLLDLELRSQGESQEQIVERCRAVIRYSVKTCHPHFFNQLFSGLDPYALAGRIVTESLNTSQYTYEIAPVFVLMEEEVLRKLRALVGWSSGDGVFCPGGSISNMYAINLARYKRYPDCKQRGLRALPPLALFTSKECHYSIQKGAAFLGLGTDSIRVVKADER